MVTIRYKEWEFTVDKEENERTYASLGDEMSKPVTCGCGSCLNFIENRESAFPLEFRHLLASLGVDYRKEADTYHSHRVEKGLHHYGGWFHARGKFKGPAVFPEGVTSGQFEMHELNPNFSIGFRYASHLHHFSSSENLIQIEFAAHVPWTLGEEGEPE